MDSVALAQLWPRVRRALARSPLQLRFRDLVLQVGRSNLYVVREDLARLYLSGSGIEIGAATFPLRVPPHVHVRHVDTDDRAGLIARVGDDFIGPHLDPEDIPEIDIVDDAQRLSTLAEASVDFVVACHVLEHLQDPIGALENWVRVLRPNGILLLTLPDARFTFDRARTRTTVDHLQRDHRDGPQTSVHDHYAEWAELIEGIGPAGVPARAAEYAASNSHHHFHVWEVGTFLHFLHEVDLGCDVLHAQLNWTEFAVVLRKYG